MATVTTHNLDVRTETPVVERTDSVGPEVDPIFEQAHSDISERNAKHEAYLAAHRENLEDGVREPVDFNDDNRGNRDGRVKVGDKDGNIVPIEAHRPDREWLQHEDFPDGVADLQVKKDARDLAERRADRVAIAAEREARENGTASAPSTTFGGLVREPVTPKP